MWLSVSQNYGGKDLQQVQSPYFLSNFGSQVECKCAKYIQYIGIGTGDCNH